MLCIAKLDFERASANFNNVCIASARLLFHVQADSMTYFLLNKETQVRACQSELNNRCQIIPSDRNGSASWTISDLLSWTAIKAAHGITRSTTAGVYSHPTT